MVMVRLLLSCGADANIQDKAGTTALMFASERGHTHIARLLLERSQCDLNLADKVTLGWVLGARLVIAMSMFKWS